MYINFVCCRCVLRTRRTNHLGAVNLRLEQQTAIHNNSSFLASRPFGWLPKKRKDKTQETNFTKLFVIMDHSRSITGEITK